MSRLITAFIVLLTFTGCTESDEWMAGPINTPGPDEEKLLKDSFYIDPGAEDLRLFLKGGKDYSLYAQWSSKTALIDTESLAHIFVLTEEETIPSRISPHAPKWWGTTIPDHVYEITMHHSYISQTHLGDGVYQYEAVRYLDLPNSVYDYFD